jgi:YD repeat-containing protein
LKVGYDGSADDDIDDAGDDLVVSSPFGSTAITPSHDDNGNLTDDGTYKYTYDAWNRLVKATLNDTDITIQQAEFDGLGRRIKKNGHEFRRLGWHDRVSLQ